MDHAEFTHMVNREAIKVKFTMGARMLLFQRYPEMQERVYTKGYLVMRFSVYAAHIVGVLLVFIAPIYYALALIMSAHYVSIQLIRYVDSVLLEMALADPYFYQAALHRQAIRIAVVPWARKQLQIG